MIPKIESSSITPIREKGVDSIVDWFDQHQHSFYTIAWYYLRNQEQMEELFYQSIKKVHKKLPQFKRETSFETWVTSIFIHTCRELSVDKSLQVSEKSEEQQELFNALDQLKENEREAIVLTYVKGISKEEAAKLLKVSEGKLKEFLFYGIQLFRKEMGNGATYNGCKEYHEVYIDYLERTLDRQRKIDLEKHLYHCQECQEDLASFQEVMVTLLNLPERMKELHMPAGFMENVKDRLAEKEKHRQQKNKKRIRIGLVFAGVFALFIGVEFFTRAFSNLYYTWAEEDQELRTFLQQDLGEPLNLEAESSGIKIKIKSAIADEVQTLIFYEIEDTEEDNQYAMENFEGIFVENQDEIMSPEGYQSYYPPDLESDVNKEEKNVFQGKMSLLPLKGNNGTIKLKIIKLHKLVRNSSDPNGFSAYGNMEYETGEWNFEIPVTKQPSVEYALDEEIKVEGIPVRFNKLSIAPTATILQYSISNKQAKKRIDDLNFDNLEVNNKKLKSEMYRGSFFDSQQDVNWFTFQKHFGTLFGEKPKEVNIQLDLVHLSYDDPKNIELDASQVYPQTFEYAGSTISIDKVEIGQPTKVVISNHEIKNRAYETLNFQIVGEDENDISSLEMSSEGVLIDKNGVEYDANQPVPFEEIEQPRHFITVQTTELQSNTAGENVIPKRLEIFGYNATKYLDDVIKITLNKK
ncbi:sigma-70 family RNA polymerase sigma factor [Neobacillus sp. 179-C4.2 HS]|uniref:Sigma-70 family RNA polymerase sigma factor n=1 Tax=Neobacillus driksii TaxID=3035913 RepID=A0ABV4YXI3_9BACI|nr:sigma-70 family RNA polymerase sigma factor [Neobacillus sp. 179.-C4.2 HS]MDP5196657.1 sigma-70 family RNA polymerase sigma factor [Neobacillus sp. 179.-C4.2 HS]